MKIHALIPATILWAPASASFTLFKGRDLNAWSESRGVTPSCMTAINTTLDCVDEFLESVISIEEYMWSEGNFTAGCTTVCENGLGNWVTTVRAECADQEMRYMGNIIKPWALPVLYQHQYQLGCMTGGESGWCWLDSLTWSGSDRLRHDPESCITGDPEWDADVCSEEGFSPVEIQPEDTQMKNLYDLDMLCNDCFLRIFDHRLRSPVLPKTNYTNHLIQQHADMESICSTEMPLTTSTEPMWLSYMPRPTPTTSEGSTTTRIPGAGTTCLGQLIEPDIGRMSCNELSEKYNVPTGDLVVLTHDFTCYVTEPICLPLPCKLEKIGWGYDPVTCDSLRESLSTAENNITAIQFSTWNKRIIGSCDDLRGDQYYCAGPPGGDFEFPPPVYAPTSTAYYTTATPAFPTSEGTIEDCGKYHDVKSGENCNTIALREASSVDEFLDLNTQVWDNCTNLWLDYSYCVAPVTPAPLSEDGSCGPDHGYAKCEGSDFGECCSYYGSCGSGSEYCGPGKCYSGQCTGGTDVSPDGTCGPDYNDWICEGSAFGDCCSIYGFCTYRSRQNQIDFHAKTVLLTRGIKAEPVMITAGLAFATAVNVIRTWAAYPLTDLADRGSPETRYAPAAHLVTAAVFTDTAVMEMHSAHLRTVTRELANDGASCAALNSHFLAPLPAINYIDLLGGFQQQALYYFSSISLPTYNSITYTEMDDSFDPVACANLHNELLRRATQHIPNASDHFRRDLIQRTLQAIPEWTEIPDLENSPIYHYLSLLDCYQPENLGPFSVPLTPEFHQPAPDSFRHPYLENIDEGSDVAWTILLYPDNTCEPEMDSGLFFNLLTGTASFTSIEAVTSPQFKDAVPRHWVPLQVVLRKALDMWDCGKFYQGPSWKNPDDEEALSIKPWIPSDVDDAISAWEDLIQAIRDRLFPPRGTDQDFTWLDPLPEHIFHHEYNVSPFAKYFLLRARRPSSFTNVAPGLTFFNEDSFRQTYEQEGIDSPRRWWNRENSDLPEKYPSLILHASPSSSTQGIPNPCLENPNFDKPWGHGKFTVSRRPGLYTDPIYADHHADSVRLIAKSGATDHVVGFPSLGSDSASWSPQSLSRPWGTDRGPRLCEVLGRFAELVRDGTWDVSRDEGVTTPASWFTDRGTRGNRVLEWTLDKR
ncbi:hypothetical protein FQN54_003364 [Arachnomyces sp. PD_36]|nr:hypothetical protein FQN54_003364 [Arachnomyces sp. PD_36]